MVYELWQNDLLARAVPLSQPFRLEAVLTSDVEIASWASEGLPSDELSLQNGLLTTRAARWPLCIDPQMQAVTWIKNREGKLLEGRVRCGAALCIATCLSTVSFAPAGHKCMEQRNTQHTLRCHAQHIAVLLMHIHTQYTQVKTFRDTDLLKQLELAVQYGFPFLLQGCDDVIDPIIDPVLERSGSSPGSCAGKRVIRLGDKEVEWDPAFRLYLTTKLPNPHFGPEVAGKTSIINYGLTQAGLAEQLLAVTVAHERPDLEEARCGQRARIMGVVNTHSITL